MYLIVLILAAFVLLSLFATNWPVKLFHHSVLKKAGEAVGARPIHGSLLAAGVYSEIKTSVADREVRIRYVEGSPDALHADSGLEMRMAFAPETTVEFYRTKLKKREWGDFKRFSTGDSLLDAEWFILCNDMEQTALFYREHPLQLFLNNRYIEQILFHSREMIIRLQKGDPVRAVTEVWELLKELTAAGDTEPGDY